MSNNNTNPEAVMGIMFIVILGVAFYFAMFAAAVCAVFGAAIYLYRYTKPIQATIAIVTVPIAVLAVLQVILYLSQHNYSSSTKMEMWLGALIASIPALFSMAWIFPITPRKIEWIDNVHARYKVGDITKDIRNELIKFAKSQSNREFEQYIHQIRNGDDTALPLNKQDYEEFEGETMDDPLGFGDDRFDFDAGRFSDRSKQREYEDHKRALSADPLNPEHGEWLRLADMGFIDGIKALPAPIGNNAPKPRPTPKPSQGFSHSWTHKRVSAPVKPIPKAKPPTPKPAPKPVRKRSAWASNVKPATAAALGWEEIKSSRHGGVTALREYESKADSMYEEIPSKRTAKRIEAEKKKFTPWLDGREHWPTDGQKKYGNYYVRYYDDASTQAEKLMCLKGMQRLDKQHGVKS